MTKNKTALFLALILTLAVCAFVIDSLVKGVQEEKEKNRAQNIHRIIYEKDLFEGGIFSQRKEIVYSSSIKGGIIPHHMLASRMIADFYYNLSKQKVDTIIILGPDHFNPQQKTPLSSRYAWTADRKTIKSNIEIIDELSKKGLIDINEEALEKDHSIGSHIPFIEEYVPDAKIVPIIFSLQFDIDRAEEFANELEKYTEKEGIILISSVDFSHYLTSSQANVRDMETISALENSDLDKIYSFSNSDNLDSPASISILLVNMKLLGINEFSVIENSNSSHITKSNDYQTTSYFSIMFFR